MYSSLRLGACPNLTRLKLRTSRDQPLITNTPNPFLPVAKLRRIRAFPDFPIRQFRPILNVRAPEAAHGVRGRGISFMNLDYRSRAVGHLSIRRIRSLYTRSFSSQLL